jgi:hypothetical protein
MEPYRIFISSIMNTATENLLAEREAARAAVEYFAPTTIAWAFENEPASPKPPLDFYINGVKSSDLFVLIVGQRLTKPVRDEFDTARDHGKPMLLFAKTVDARETAVNQLLHSANVKYDKFANATELREKDPACRWRSPAEAHPRRWRRAAAAGRPSGSTARLCSNRYAGENLTVGPGDDPIQDLPREVCRSRHRHARKGTQTARP